MNKAQEMYRRTLHGKETVRASAEEFYNEILLDIGDRADKGFFNHYFEKNETPDFLRPHIESEVIPIFEENGFHITELKSYGLFGNEQINYEVNWYQTGEKHE